MQSPSISFDVHIHTRHNKHQQIIANCFPPNLCFRFFSGQSFCTVPFPYQAVVSRKWLPYQSLMCCQLSRKCSCTYFGIPFFQAQENYRFPLGIGNNKLCHPLKNLFYRKWWGSGSSNIWGHASLESDPFSMEPRLNHFLEEILRGIYIYYPYIM